MRMRVRLTGSKVKAVNWKTRSPHQCAKAGVPVAVFSWTMELLLASRL
jgi:hypothetical protein